MKKMKLVAAAIVTMALFASALPVSAHDAVSNVAWGTPVIDGVKDDIYESANMIEIKEIAIGDDLPEDQVATAKAWTLWDGEFLYVYVEVSDSIIDAEDKDAIWDQDALGIAVDYAYNRTPEENYRELDDNDRYAGYINVSPIAADTTQFYPEMVTIMGLDQYSSKIKSHLKTTDYGYAVEAAIPLIYRQYSAGDKIGFEIFVNNGIGEGSRAGQVMWKQYDDANGTEAWRYTANMGTLIFLEKPAEPEPTEAAVEETPEIPAPAAPENAAPPAPQTGDFAAGALAVVLLAAFAFAATKRLFVRAK